MNKILTMFFYLLVGTFLCIMMGFSYKKASELQINNININIKPVDSSNLITDKEIRTILDLNIDSALSALTVDLNLNELEKKLDKNPFVKKSQIFYSNNRLCIDVIQEKPFFRLIDNNKHYLVTHNGTLIPTSKSYIPHLVFVYASRSQIKDVIYLVTLLDNNDFYKESIYDITFKKDVILSTRIGNYKIIINNMEDILQKLNNFQIFSLLNATQLASENYDTVVLSFNNQIICTKTN